VAEGSTLKVMLDSLSAPPGALVIMDAGIATEANLIWLNEQGYRYLVVRRGGTRQFDLTSLVEIETASGEPLQLQKEISSDGKEAFLYCYSEGRDAKETAMFKQFSQTFEAGLQKISDGLEKPRTQKGINKINERIGRLKQKSHSVSQHYTIEIKPDESGEKVESLKWEKTLVNGTMATQPGIYCLRSNEVDWDEERMWRTYSMLTDLESVFRRLKSELGLRPVFHSKEERSDGHLFITVLAYQCVQVLRTQLKKADINQSWESLRKTLSIQQRVTASQRRKDGRTIHVRKSTVAETALLSIYQALNISTTPGGTKKLIV
jgi:transposase